MAEKTTWPPNRGRPYEQIIPSDGHSPRVRKGTVWLFDPRKAPKVGDVVAVWYNDVPDSDCVVGVLTRFDEDRGTLLLNADATRVLAFRRRNMSVDPAVRPVSQ